MHLHEVAVVHHRPDDLPHLVRLRRPGRYRLPELGARAARLVAGLLLRRVLGVVAREEAQQPAHLRQALLLPVEGEVGHPARCRVRVGPAKLLVGDLLARDGLDDVRARDVHLPLAPDHEDEVRERRRVDPAARGGPHHNGDLRDDAGRQRVAQEDVAVALQAVHALLDARPARVHQPHHRRAHLHRQVHGLADLRPNDLRQRAAHDGEVLREDEDQPPVHQPVACDDGVAQDPLLGQAELRGPVRDEGVQLFEGARVQEQVDALPGGQLPLCVLLLDAPFPAPEPGAVTHALQGFQPLRDTGFKRHYSLEAPSQGSP